MSSHYCITNEETLTELSYLVITPQLRQILHHLMVTVAIKGNESQHKFLCRIGIGEKFWGVMWLEGRLT